MEHVPIFTLVVITLLQLCRAQSSDSTPEWYAANDINETNYLPKPITDLFSTEPSFSPEDPIIVLSPSSPLPSNIGIVSSPTPNTQYTDDTESQPPPSVIPLSSTELPLTEKSEEPSPPQTSPTETTQSDTQPQTLSTTPQEAPNTQTNTIPRMTQNLPSSQLPSQPPRGNIAQNGRPNQPLISSRIPQQQTPRNIQFLLPTPTGNRVFQGQQLPSNGHSSVFVLYEQPPIRNMPPAILPIPPQTPQQQIVARPPNMVVRPPPQVPQQQQPIQVPQPNPVPPANIPPPNIIVPAQPNPVQAPVNQHPSINQQPINPVTNQAPITNPMPNVQQITTRYQAPIPMTPPPVTTTIQRRPLRQRNRVNSGRLNNRNKPCQNSTQNSVITIRLRPSLSRNTMQINPVPNANISTTARPRPNSQLNNRNYERCLNSCRDRKDRICAGPARDVQITSDNLKGFPSMCHMACHNTFRANPIYEKIANGRCGKLRTRIQTVDKSKIRRDELKKSEYTIISNIPGTVVELAP